LERFVDLTAWLAFLYPQLFALAAFYVDFRLTSKWWLLGLPLVSVSPLFGAFWLNRRYKSAPSGTYPFADRFYADPPLRAKVALGALSVWFLMLGVDLVIRPHH
jgi:hypothetical protein